MQGIIQDTEERKHQCQPAHRSSQKYEDEGAGCQKGDTPAKHGVVANCSRGNGPARTMLAIEFRIEGIIEKGAPKKKQRCSAE